MISRNSGILLLCCLLVACSQEAKQLPQQPLKPNFIGMVDHVYPKQKYVLIRIAGFMPNEGTTLISQSPEGEGTRIANLLVSGERLGNLRVPADIRSGTIEQGDLVFAYRGLSSPDSKNTPISPDQETDDKKSKEDPHGDADSPTQPKPEFNPLPGGDGLIPIKQDDSMPVASPATPTIETTIPHNIDDAPPVYSSDTTQKQN
ncbi:MAG: hypothetical protein RSE01_05775 [Akkermansia sp.]